MSEENSKLYSSSAKSSYYAIEVATHIFIVAFHPIRKVLDDKTDRVS